MTESNKFAKWKCIRCGASNWIKFDICQACGTGKDGNIKDPVRFELFQSKATEVIQMEEIPEEVESDEIQPEETVDPSRPSNVHNNSGQSIAQPNMTHWIVLVVAIIVASIGFYIASDNPFRGGTGPAWLQLAIFLALVARIVQADIHYKSRK